MIIWRGWGILGLFVTPAGVLGTLAVMHTLLETSESASALGDGIRSLLAGVADFFLGRQLNIIRPAQNTEDFRNQLRADLWERVANGAFQMAPGAPELSFETEAVQQIEQVVAGESRNAERTGRKSTPSSSSPFSGLVRSSASEASCSPSTRPSPAEQPSRVRFHRGAGRR